MYRGSWSESDSMVGVGSGLAFFSGPCSEKGKGQSPAVAPVYISVLWLSSHNWMELFIPMQFWALLSLARVDVSMEATASGLKFRM